MASRARSLTLLLAVLYLFAVLAVPGAAAEKDAEPKESKGGKTHGDDAQAKSPSGEAPASAAVQTDEKQATALGGLASLSFVAPTVIVLDPLQYILDLSNAVGNRVNQMIGSGEGMACAYGDPSNPRGAMVCWCIDSHFNCKEAALLDDWNCYATAGPLTNIQAGIVCLPPRAKV